MHLARDKYGRIGRRVRAMGESAVVALPSVAASLTNVEVSPAMIDKNQHYWEAKEKALQKELSLKRQQREAKQAAKNKEIRAQAAKVAKLQMEIPMNPIEQALKKQFALQAKASESSKVVKSLKADFYDREFIPVPEEKIRVSARSGDFEITNLVGNPLTRDGRYGVVTDYDRLVRGQELDNANVQLVGGTILRKLPNKRRDSSMGWEWEDVGNWFSDTASNTADQLQEQLPAEIANQLKDQLFPPTVNPQTGVVTVNRPGTTNYVQNAAQSLNVPPVVIYGAMGMMGVGLLLVLVKALK